MKNKKGFTLIELLIVVLIIGILAAIAVPQYKKAVIKADLHRGISLVNSLYQAQQSYYLAHGDFTADIDELDVSFPKDSSCNKTKSTNTISAYDCDFGRIYNNKTTNIQFQTKSRNMTNRTNNMAYVIQLKDSEDLLQRAGKRYCFSEPDNAITQDICINMGGTFVKETETWTVYLID